MSVPYKPPHSESGQQVCDAPEQRGLLSRNGRRISITDSLQKRVDISRGATAQKYVKQSESGDTAPQGLLDTFRTGLLTSLSLRQKALDLQEKALIHMRRSLAARERAVSARETAIEQVALQLSSIATHQGAGSLSRASPEQQDALTVIAHTQHQSGRSLGSDCMSSSSRAQDSSNATIRGRKRHRVGKPKEMEYMIYRKSPGPDIPDSDKLGDPRKRSAVASGGAVGHNVRSQEPPEVQVQAARLRHSPKKLQQVGSQGLVADFAESTRAALPPTARASVHDMGSKRGTDRREGELNTRDTPSQATARAASGGSQATASAASGAGRDEALRNLQKQLGIAASLALAGVRHPRSSREGTSGSGSPPTLPSPLSEIAKLACELELDQSSTVPPGAQSGSRSPSTVPPGAQSGSRSPTQTTGSPQVAMRGESGGVRVDQDSRLLRNESNRSGAPSPVSFAPLSPPNSLAALTTSSQRRSTSGLVSLPPAASFMLSDLDDADEDEEGSTGVAHSDEDSEIEDGTEAWKLPRSRRRSHRRLLVNSSSPRVPRARARDEGSPEWWQDYRAKLERFRKAQKSRGLVRMSGEAGSRDQARHHASSSLPSSPANPVHSLASPTASREQQHSQVDHQAPPMSVFKDKQQGTSLGMVCAAARRIADGAQVYCLRESDRGQQAVVPVPPNNLSRSTAHDLLAVELGSGWMVTSMHRIELACYSDQADGKKLLYLARSRLWQHQSCAEIPVEWVCSRKTSSMPPKFMLERPIKLSNPAVSIKFAEHCCNRAPCLWIDPTSSQVVEVPIRGVSRFHERRPVCCISASREAWLVTSFYHLCRASKHGSVDEASRRKCEAVVRHYCSWLVGADAYQSDHEADQSEPPSKIRRTGSTFQVRRRAIQAETEAELSQDESTRQGACSTAGATNNTPGYLPPASILQRNLAGVRIPGSVSIGIYRQLVAGQPVFGMSADGNTVKQIDGSYFSNMARCSAPIACRSQSGTTWLVSSLSRLRGLFKNGALPIAQQAALSAWVRAGQRKHHRPHRKGRSERPRGGSANALNPARGKAIGQRHQASPQASMGQGGHLPSRPRGDSFSTQCADRGCKVPPLALLQELPRSVCRADSLALAQELAQGGVAYHACKGSGDEDPGMSVLPVEENSLTSSNYRGCVVAWSSAESRWVASSFSRIEQQSNKGNLSKEVFHSIKRRYWRMKRISSVARIAAGSSGRARTQSSLPVAASTSSTTQQEATATLSSVHPPPRAAGRSLPFHSSGSSSSRGDGSSAGWDASVTGDGPALLSKQPSLQNAGGASPFAAGPPQGVSASAIAPASRQSPFFNSHASAPAHRWSSLSAPSSSAVSSSSAGSGAARARSAQLEPAGAPNAFMAGSTAPDMGLRVGVGNGVESVRRPRRDRRPSRRLEDGLASASVGWEAPREAAARQGRGVWSGGSSTGQIDDEVQEIEDLTVPVEPLSWPGTQSIDSVEASAIEGLPELIV